MLVCVKNDVRVLTPYFKYNFADKHEGPYHRLLFRMRAEQAADFLNSYVRGRLVAAKERMMLLGMWMGGNINLGFMVDNRKYLPSGIPNPNWRKVEADRIWSRLRVHYTPTHGSWLNMAEIEIGILSRQCLRRRLLDAWSLATEVIAWEQFRNAAQAKIHWSFTVQDACHVFHTDYSRILAS